MMKKKKDRKGKGEKRQWSVRTAQSWEESEGWMDVWREAGRQKGKAGGKGHDPSAIQ